MIIETIYLGYQRIFFSIKLFDVRPSASAIISAMESWIYSSSSNGGIVTDGKPHGGKQIAEEEVHMVIFRLRDVLRIRSH